MKVVFVNRFYAPDHSATSQMLTDLATSLAADGVDVHVVTSRLRYDEPGVRLPRSEVRDGVTVHRVGSTAVGRGALAGRAADYLTFHAAVAARLLRLLERGDVVVAKTDPPLVSVPAGWCARVRGARHVNWLQDVFPEVAAELGLRVARGPIGRLAARMRDASLRSAVANVAIGECMRDRVAARGIDPATLTVIPNWADGDAIHPVPPEANALRRDWDLRDRFVVGYSGNMGRAHEFGTLLDAASALRDDAGIVFLLIGDGAQRGAVATAARERGLASLRFEPYQPRERLHESLSAADVHVVTLRPALEGLIVPSKFYGIAAAGRPAIAIGDPDGEIGAEVRRSECGLCVREGDAAGLVAAIRALRDDVPRRERMGSNARALLEARYERRIAARQWQALLQAVGSGEPVPRA